MVSKGEKALAAVFVAVAIGVAISVVQVGRAYEQRSLYSYLLKTGDADAASVPALKHVEGARSQGLMVAAQLATASLLLGAVLGVFVARVVTRGRTRRMG